jgi:hypothetical protein
LSAENVPSSEGDGEEDPRLTETEERLMLSDLRLSPPSGSEERQAAVAPDGLALDGFCEWLKKAT